VHVPLRRLEVRVSGGRSHTNDDVTVARKNAQSIDRAMAPLATIAGGPASYVSESNFFVSSSASHHQPWRAD
jgi:hypothetical protein